MTHNDAQFAAEFNRRFPGYYEGGCDPIKKVEAETWRMRNASWSPKLFKALKKNGIDASEVLFLLGMQDDTDSTFLTCMSKDGSLFIFLYCHPENEEHWIEDLEYVPDDDTLADKAHIAGAREIMGLQSGPK